MRKEYKNGLFFVLGIVIIIVLAVLWRHYLLSESSTRKQQEEENTGNNEVGISQAQNMNITTTCDTICIYEDIDKKDGTISFQEEKIPAKYIGMSREELEKTLSEDKGVSLENKAKGFQSQHLELFSKEKIKIVRIYDTSQEDTGFYIMAYNHYVSVFRPDQETLYFQSDIKVEDLPASVQQEVIKGKYMSSEIEVFHFLESYSS